ncbi:MAG: single-stranded-DNA-specific exonuclease RecJ [Oscillospiraceae bacterium]|jgi:single-stranded-DNA-specific exonuclease|nr:single-stranded-DNA-specific exonuclease RecJ [Oscillospiraceae bacterium]
MPDIERADIQALSGQTGKDSLVCAVLAARGVSDKAGIDAFFASDGVLDAHDTIKDMDKAVARIRDAMENEERIAVYGDYDCDGITATALLTSYFQSVGTDVIYYVPSREKEGDGLNKGAIDILKQQKVDLIVTVDNGISAHEEVLYANTLGIDIVITDHHTPRDTLPAAVAVVNPHRSDCPSRFKDLAGVGVAFKLICALEDADGLELLEYYSDIVALGTVADVVTLTDENRVIVKHGLDRLANTDNAGINALIEASGLSGKTITGESAAFGLIPRINACGRMGTADDAIELLLTDDPDFAAETAAMINEQNAARKNIEDSILTEITAQIASDPAMLNGRMLIVSGAGWHHGVVGIVAARMMEKYAKPCIVFSVDDGVARGSGRSIEGFSLIEAISACGEKLTQYGGHKLAAGLTLAADDLPAFHQAIERHAAERYPVMPVVEFRADYIMEPEDLNIDAVGKLSVLEPFGAGNEAPVFMLPGLRIEGIYPTSDGKHVRIRFQFGNHLFYAVYFSMPEKELPYKVGDVTDVLAGVSAGEWNGSPQLSVRIKDMRPQGVDQENLISAFGRYMSHLRAEYGAHCAKEEITPAREDIAVVYRHIKSRPACRGDYEDIYYGIRESGVDFCRMRIALDVLLEMKLIEKDGARFGIVAGAPRADLAQSSILSALRA